MHVFAVLSTQHTHGSDPDTPGANSLGKQLD